MELNSIKKISNEIDRQSLSDKEIALNQLHSIIEKLPTELSQLIESAFVNMRIPVEYLFSSILFAYSNAAGLAFSIDALGYVNYANLYFAIIGNRGDVKTAGMKLATDIFNKYDAESYNDEGNDELENVKNKKFLIQNATIQAAQYSHYYNKYSTGIFIDELTSLIEKMANKNNADGIAWRTFLLEGYNNTVIDILRKTTESFRIEKSYPTLIGSIQEQFVANLFGNGNLESGFIDRILFTPKLTSNTKISRDKIPSQIRLNYNENLNKVIKYRRTIEEDLEIEELQLILENDAENLLLNYVQELVDKQETALNNIKEYLSKLQISIHKHIILVHLIKNAKTGNFHHKIDVATVQLAIEINEFYFTNFKIINHQNQSKDTKPVDIDKVIELAIKNAAPQTSVVEISGLSKGTVSKRWNKVLNNTKLETEQQNASTHSN